MNSKKRIALLGVTLFVLCFSSVTCKSEKLPVKNIEVERDGQIIAVVKAEIAVSPEERSKGLMYRKSLKDGNGMLFIFDKDEVMSFWMKNTYVPLSIAFIAGNGKIIDIKDMYPLDTNSVFSSRSVRYALETPQGWFSRAGVKEGDSIKLDSFR
jgi:uncharacterized membrane protein (UPF0127 family)